MPLGAGVPLGAGPCCPDVGRCLSWINIIIIIHLYMYEVRIVTY